MSTDTKRKVLIIEDEKPISDIIKFNLTKEGYEVETAYDGQEGLDKALSCGPQLVLLDIMLPMMSGFEVCKKIRETSEVPIIMLTAKEEEADKVLGLELGADDYITKPFGMRELLARIKANLRRSELMTDKDDAPADVQVFGRLEIDMNRYEVRKDGKPLDLTLREFELLRYLATRDDKVFSREQLLEDVWGYEYYGDIRTVDVTIRRLREKLEDDPGDPGYIITKRGIGYFFKKQ
ncbi:MAG: response regulator transcription factor [Clostridia bacterium]|nr:response regulator transcription factor [Clostridia bacterium]